MKVLISSLLAIGLMLSSSPLAAGPVTSELEKRLHQQERRIDRLERVVEAIQDQLLDSQYGETDAGNSRAPDRNTVDPLVGSWECSNNVFNYDIYFYADGRLLQEEPFFSKVRKGRWLRLGENQFATEQGVKFSEKFLSNDELMVTNLATQSVWECSRKQ